MGAQHQNSPARVRRLVIIGTPTTAKAAAAAIESLADRPKVVGTLLLADDRAGKGAPATIDLDRAPTLTALADLAALHERQEFDTALVSLPAAMGHEGASVRATLRRLGVVERVLPTIEDVLSGVTAGAHSAGDRADRPFVPPRAIDMLSLVGRKPHPFDKDAVRRALAGKRVLITGAGGSIGSELARIVASVGPCTLALMDRSENALFEINRQIGAAHPGLAKQAILHDVVEADPTLRRLVALRPQIVFHAAAHKHVPMMEDHPAHAVNNNVFGTKSLADAALAVGVERFVMISSDKAVNPTSVMGATKRMAEMYVRSLNRWHGSPGRSDRPGAVKPRFCMVRFGNVLGSACSVMPIWEKQINEGGPITVTDARMTRYFMTIPEAAALVIQAGALEPEDVADADVFVLDMGEPVRILDLAERFVRAHGLAPVMEGASGTPGNAGKNGTYGNGRAAAADEIAGAANGTMRVVLTGARPGEKLYEELAHTSEELRPTPTPGILAWAGPPADPSEVTEMIADLSAVRTSPDDKSVLRTIIRWTPGMAERGVRLVSEPLKVGAA